MSNPLVSDESSSCLTACAAESSASASPGADRWLAARRTALWLLLSAAGAIGVAWVAIQAQNHGFAPVGLTAIAIGALVAEISRRAASSTGAQGLRKRLFVAMLAALWVIVAQDYIGFSEHVGERSRFQSANPRAAIFAADDHDAGPAAFLDFLRSRVRRSPLLWGCDAALTVVGAMVWTVVYSRRTTTQEPGKPPLNTNPSIER